MGQVAPGWKAAVLSAEGDHLAGVATTGRLAVDLQQSSLAWFDGYANDPTATAARFSGDGRWYLAGDCARVDREGNFYFASREDDVIIMAGYRIGPAEVEAVLLRHPAIQCCAVVAGPDEIRGEVLEAFVVLRAGCVGSEELTAEIQAWVKRHYAAHAYPRRVHFVNGLPRTPSGKIQRFSLRERLRARNGVPSDRCAS